MPHTGYVQSAPETEAPSRDHIGIDVHEREGQISGRALGAPARGVELAAANVTCLAWYNRRAEIDTGIARGWSIRDESFAFAG